MASAARSRYARDGANIVVTAKTVETHGTLPGAVYSVATEVVAAVGKALALQLDVRYEDAVAAAVNEAARVVGSIDILVLNASPISLSGSAATPVKRYDL